MSQVRQLTAARNQLKRLRQARGYRQAYEAAMGKTSAPAGPRKTPVAKR